jgi:hypothetical protein
MRAEARRLALLFLGCSLLAAACQLLAPRPPTAPAPPGRELTLCERPARPAAAAHAPGGRRQIRDEFETELRPTGSQQAPWVGVLRYCEQALHCTGASAASCQPSKSTAVTELFRFQAGEWMY